jgi:hypothetical protein
MKSYAILASVIVIAVFVIWLAVTHYHEQHMKDEERQLQITLPQPLR